MQIVELLLVGSIVLVAAAYSTWALLPKSARLRLANALTSTVEGRAFPGWLRRAALALQRRAHAGGGHCDDCGGPASVRREETRR